MQTPRKISWWPGLQQNVLVETAVEKALHKLGQLPSGIQGMQFGEYNSADILKIIFSESYPVDLKIAQD